MIFSFGYVVYFSFVVFMSRKVIWSETPKLKKIQVTITINKKYIQVFKCDS